MTDHLENNLRLLHDHQPDVVRRLLDAAPDPTYQLVGVDDGSLVVVRRQEGQVTALSHPDRAEDRAREFADRQRALLDSAEPLCFAGLRAGYEVRAMMARLRREDFEPARGVYVLEETIDVLRLALAAHDWSPQLADGQLFFFVGPEATEQCRRFFLDDLAKPPPQRVIPLAGAEPARRALAAVQALVGELSTKVKAAKDVLRERYDNLPALDLARRYFDPRGLRFLLINNKLSYFVQHSIRDLKTALTHLGATVQVLEERSLVDRVTGPLQLTKVASFAPDGVLFVDRGRHEAGDAYPPGLPFFCFVQDFMQGLMDPAVAARAGRRDQFIGYVEHLVHHPEPTKFLLPAWTEPETYAREPVGDRPDFDADIVFVSNITISHEAAHELLREHWGGRDAALGPVVDEIYQRAAQLDRRGEMFDNFDRFRDLLLSLLAARGVALERPLTFVVDVYDRLINPWLRHQPLEWAAAAGYTLALYGRGWERHERLGRFARGVASNGPELAEIYRSAPVNLHINQYGIEHPRIHDGLLAGAFFLVRRTFSLGLLELDDCFFSTRDQLLAQLAHFTKHPEKRRAIVATNQQRIRQWGTFEADLRNSFAHLGLRLVGEAIARGELDDLPDALADRHAQAEAVLRDLADRYALDATAFGLHALVELLLLAERLPVVARDRLREWDAFGDRWGCDRKGAVVEPAAREKIAAWLPSLVDDAALADRLRVLTAAWRELEPPAGLAYRYRQDGVALPPGANELISAHASLAPAWRDRHVGGNQRPPLVRRTDVRRLSESEAMCRSLGEGLAVQGAVAGHFAALAELTEHPAAGREVKIRASRAAYLAGRRSDATRWLDDIVARDAGDFEAVALRALIEWSCARLTDAEAWLNRAAQIAPHHEAVALLRARLLLSAGDFGEAAKVLAAATKSADTGRREFGAHFSAVARALAGEGGPNQPLLGGGQVELVRSWPVPPDGENAYRFDRLRLWGDRLVLRCAASPARAVVCDADGTSWSPLADALQEPIDLGVYPALDTAGDRLFAVDIAQGALVEFDGEGRLVGRRELGEVGRGFVADIAVAPTGAVGSIDAYRGRLVLVDTAGHATRHALPGIDPNLPLRLAARDEGFWIFNGGAVVLLDVEGHVRGHDTVSSPGDAWFADARGFLVARGFAPAVEFRDASLKAQFAIAATPGHAWLHPCAAATREDAVFVVDDFAGRVFELRRR